MRINLRGAWAGLPILLAMGAVGGGVALWRVCRRRRAVRDGGFANAVAADHGAAHPWRRKSGARIDTQSFSPIAIPLSGAKLIAWRPQGSGGEMELTLSWSTVPALFSWLARGGMNPRSFSLEREGRRSAMRLQLEAEDER